MRRISKFICVGLIACIVVPMFGPVSASSIYVEDFESYSVGDKTAGMDTCSGQVVADGDNQYIAFSLNQSAEKYIDAQSGLVNVSFSFMETAPGNARAIMLWDSSHSKRSALLWLIESGKIVSANTEGNTELADFTLNVWNTVTLNLNFDTQEITQIYINGKPTLMQSLPMYQLGESVNDLGCITFQMEGADGVYCVDNIKVEKVLYPDLSEALESAQVLLNSEEGTTGGKYPHSAFTMLADVCDAATAALSTEGLTQVQRDAWIEKIHTAATVFRESVIQTEITPIYTNDMSAYEIGSQPTGFTVANNTLVQEVDGNKAAYLGPGVSRLLYTASREITGEYEISMRFMQPEKGPVHYLFDCSDIVGNQHAVWVSSDGADLLVQPDISAKNGIAVWEDYKANTWYTLRAVLSTASQQYTLYCTEEGQTEIELGTFDFASDGVSGIGRFSNTQITEAAVSCYIDDICVKPYLPMVENDVNSISISAPEYMLCDQEVAVTAQVFDKKYQNWPANVTYRVVSGDAEIDETGCLTAAQGYSGIIKIKAETEKGIYDYASIICLSREGFYDVEAAATQERITVSGKYDNLALRNSEVKISISANGFSDEIQAQTEGNTFFAQFAIPEDIKTGMVDVMIECTEYGVNETLQVKYYGNDVETAFVTELNLAQIKTDIIDEYAALCNIALGPVYIEYKAEYEAAIQKYGALETMEAVRNCIDELNLLIGVKYGKRENIEAIILDGMDRLQANGLESTLSNLSEGHRDELYIAIMGYQAETVAALAAKLNEEIDAILSEKEPGKADVPKYTGGNRTGGGGGGSGGGNFSVAYEPPVDLPPSTETPEPERAFQDLDESMWAYDAIMKLNELGVMEGYDGYICPNDGVTRAEFAKMLLKAFHLSCDMPKTDFSDFDKTQWWSETIGVIAGCGIMNGRADGSFAPDDAITRQEAAATLMRTIQFANLSLYTKNEEVVFADSGDIDNYAKEAVSTLQKFGILSGIGNNLFAPKAAVTRAEAAMMIFNLYAAANTNSDK